MRLTILLFASLVVFLHEWASPRRRPEQMRLPYESQDEHMPLPPCSTRRMWSRVLLQILSLVRVPWVSCYGHGCVFLFEYKIRG